MSNNMYSNEFDNFYSENNEKYSYSDNKEYKQCDNGKKYLVGNSVNFLVGKNDCEIKADVVVNVKESIRVWGQVKDCFGNTVEGALVKLLRKTPNGLRGISHTISDCRGFYQFDIENCNDRVEYTILVGKSSNCRERIVTKMCNNRKDSDDTQYVRQGRNVNYNKTNYPISDSEEYYSSEEDSYSRW